MQGFVRNMQLVNDHTHNKFYESLYQFPYKDAQKVASKLDTGTIKLYTDTERP